MTKEELEAEILIRYLDSIKLYGTDGISQVINILLYEAHEQIENLKTQLAIYEDEK